MDRNKETCPAKEDWVEESCPGTKPSHCGGNIYVNGFSTSTNQDGKTWETAYSTLQQGLNKADRSSGKVYILVAAGTYFPSVQFPKPLIGGKPDPRNYTFRIPKNTCVVGGFKGGEKSISESNPNINVTILSGGNYYRRVVFVAAGTKVALRNLSIRGGNADDWTGSSEGGSSGILGGSGSAIFIEKGCDVSISGLSVSNNRCKLAGSLYSSGGTLRITNSKFLDNASDLEGGAVRIVIPVKGEPSADALIKDCIFERNTSVSYGGAISIKSPLRDLGDDNSKVRIEGSVIRDNTASIGAGLYVNSVDVTIEGTSFLNNVAATAGGGLVCKNSLGYVRSKINDVKYVEKTVTVNQCKFSYNKANGVQPTYATTNPDDTFPSGAAAAASFIKGKLVVDASDFKSNVSYGSGGAVINGVAYQGSLFDVPIESTDATTIITNSKFSYNKSLFGNGGAIYSVNQEGSILRVNGTKFCNNSAPNGEGNNIYYEEL